MVVYASGGYSAMSITVTDTSSPVVIQTSGAQGPPGLNGAAGTSATVSAGTATALASGSSPTVTNVGTSSAAIFDFGIPAGTPGPSGLGSAVSNGTYTAATVTVSGGQITGLANMTAADVTNVLNDATLAGALNFGGNLIKDYAEQIASITLSASGNLPVNFSLGAIQEINLDASASSMSISNIPSSGSASMTLIITQGATGGPFTIVWPTGTKWPGGIAPVLSTVAGAIDIVVLTTPNAGTTWYGFLAGKGMA